MATSSVIEIIGGAQGNGGLNTGSGGVGGNGNTSTEFNLEEGEVNPYDLLWLKPEIGNHIYGALSFVQFGAAAFVWFYVLNGGVGYTNYYLWALAAGMLSVAIAWGPVMIGYLLLFIDTPATDTIWLVVCLLSIDGPMIGYILAIVIMLIGYFQTVNTGIVYSSEL